MNAGPLFANLGDTLSLPINAGACQLSECDLSDGYKALYGCHGWIITQIWNKGKVAVDGIVQKRCGVRRPLIELKIFSTGQGYRPSGPLSPSLKPRAFDSPKGARR